MPDLEIFRPRQMTRWARLKDTVRGITLGPWNPKDRAIARYFGGGSSTLSGVSVTEDTAMTVSAVWSAVTMISDDIASLPLMLYKRLPNGGKDRFESHRLYELLHDAPNPEMDSMVLRRTMQAHALIWQNAYAEIERDVVGRPKAIWPLIPESVQLIRKQGAVFYRVYNPSGSTVDIPAEDMIHLVGYSYDGSVGCSLVQKARESFGLALAAEKYGASFFGNGASMGGVVTVDGAKPSPQVEKEHRDQIEARHMGVERAHKMLVLYNGAKYTSNVIPPNAGQFNETRLQQIRETARWFKIPPHKLGDLADATYSNVEQMDAAYMSSCIRPWLRLWEQQLSRKLISPMERRQQFIEHETHGFLSVDAAARAQLYTSEFRIGAIKINEIRGYENRDPIDGGDRVFVPRDVWPLDRLDELINAELEAKKPQKPEPPPVPQKTDAAAEEIKALHEALAEARKATQLAEDLRDLAVAERDVERDLHGVTRTELAGVRSASDEAVAALTAELRQAEAVRDEAERRCEEVREYHAKALESAVVASREADERADRVQAQLTASATERERLTAEWNSKVLDAAAAVVAAEADRDAALALAAEAERTVTATMERIAAAETRAEQAEQARETAEGLRIAAEAERETAIRQRDEVMADAAKTLAALEVANQAAGAYIAERQALAETAQRFEAERDTALTTVQTLTAEADTLRADLARARADIATELDRARSHKATMLAAMRSLFVDASERQLQKEIDRARKHQATPAKLRAWIEGFYPMQEASVRAAFQPIVGPWTALTGGAPNLLLDRLVAEHIEASRTALTQVADVDEADAMAAALERTLYRWEHERADAMADALVREGMGQHG